MKILKAIGVIVLIAVIVWFLIGDRKDINTVKNTPISFEAGATYGKVLGQYCSNTKWKKFTSNTYQGVVEFKGNSPEGKVLIQFVQRLGRDDFELSYMELDGYRVDEWEATNFFMNALYGG
jgi:hypothetical protein